MMKQTILAAMAALALAAAGCNDDNDNNGGDGSTSGALSDILFENGTQIGNGDQEFTLPVGKYTLPKGTYELYGWVYIPDGAELTLEPGTVIKGVSGTKASLIVERGGKLHAVGTQTEPIVFTSDRPAGSRRPGDWGGLILLGKAVNNKGEMTIEGGPRANHGGQDNSDSSGELCYVRVEFAGYPYREDEEINGITFGSVGSGTKVSHVQVSYTNDDSYEWFGGAVNCDHLVAYHGWDDDFDTDNGFSGKVQFCLGVRNPRLADTSVSNGFESDNNGDGSVATPRTSCVFSNVTFVGPIGQDASFSNTSDYINGGSMMPDNGSKLGQFQAAMQIRRNSNLSCFNSVAMGFPVGLIVENDKGSDTQGDATAGKFKIANVVFAAMTQLGSDANKKFSEDMGEFSAAYFQTAALNNRIYDNISDLKLTQPNSLASGFDCRPAAGSPLLTGASFTDALVSEGFEKVDYIGAFSADDDWTEGWTEFDPQNAQY